MMVDWVHCNSCYKQPDSGKKFSLTNCGHLFCEECTPASQEGKQECKVCKNRCLIIPLTSQMKQDVQLYFTEPGELLQKRLQEVLQVISFQREHRHRLISKNREKVLKFNELYNEFKNILRRLKELENENKILKDENAYLKKLVSNSRSSKSSPVSVPGTPGAPHFLMGKLGLNTPTSVQSSHNTYTSPSYKYTEQSNSSLRRLSVRTPPINGRMGIIPGRKESPYSNVSSVRSTISDNNETPVISPNKPFSVYSAQLKNPSQSVQQNPLNSFQESKSHSATAFHHSGSATGRDPSCSSSSLTESTPKNLITLSNLRSRLNRSGH